MSLLKGISCGNAKNLTRNIDGVLQIRHIVWRMITTILWDSGDVLIRLNEGLTDDALKQKCNLEKVAKYIASLESAQADASMAVFGTQSAKAGIFPQSFGNKDCQYSSEMVEMQNKFHTGKAKAKGFADMAVKFLSVNFGYVGDVRHFLKSYGLLLESYIEENMEVYESLAKQASQRGLKVALVSNNNPYHFGQVLSKKYGRVPEALPQERVFLSHKVGCMKTKDGKMFGIVLEALGSRPEEAVMIDDVPGICQTFEGLGGNSILVGKKTDLAKELAQLGIGV